MGRTRKPCVNCGGKKPAGRKHATCGKCGEVLQVPEETRLEAIRLRQEEGLSFREIARRLYCSSGTVGKILRLHGMEIVKVYRPRPPAVSEDDVQRAVELYGSGLSFNEVARALGWSRTTVQHRLGRVGVTSRGRSRATVLARRRAVAVNGRRALTERQRVAFEFIERHGPSTTADVGAMLPGVDYYAVRRALSQLQDMGLLKRSSRTEGSSHARRWLRTDVRFGDVVDFTLAEPNGNPPDDEKLPIAPFRAWVEDWIAREERKAQFVSLPSRDGGDGTGGLQMSGIVARRLGLSDRRLWALRYAQEHISIAVADRILTASDTGVRLEDLWPELEFTEELAA